MKRWWLVMMVSVVCTACQSVPRSATADDTTRNGVTVYGVIDAGVTIR